MKKGISLIVLVITIIVMIIIAGAIILSLNSTNVIQKANEAVEKSDAANVRNALMVIYAEKAASNNGIALKADGNLMTAADYADALVDQKAIPESLEATYAALITVDQTTGVPRLDGTVNQQPATSSSNT